jgi:Cdc6-like AAA superfamily ATPase
MWKHSIKKMDILKEGDDNSEEIRKKIFVICGPPGTGKTLLYEMLKSISMFKDPNSFVIVKVNDNTHDNPISQMLQQTNTLEDDGASYNNNNERIEYLNKNRCIIFFYDEVHPQKTSMFTTDIQNTKFNTANHNAMRNIKILYQDAF